MEVFILGEKAAVDTGSYRYMLVNPNGRWLDGNVDMLWLSLDLVDNNHSYTVLDFESLCVVKMNLKQIRDEILRYNGNCFAGIILDDKGELKIPSFLPSFLEWNVLDIFSCRIYCGIDYEYTNNAIKLVNDNTLKGVILYLYGKKYEISITSQHKNFFSVDIDGVRYADFKPRGFEQSLDWHCSCMYLFKLGDYIVHRYCIYATDEFLSDMFYFTIVTKNSDIISIHANDINDMFRSRLYDEELALKIQMSTGGVY